MNALSCADVIAAFPDELARAVAALADVPAAPVSSATGPGAGYLVTLVASDGGTGSLFVQIDRAGADGLACRALASSEPLPESDVIEALRDLCGQAAAAIVENARLEDVRVKVDAVEVVTDTALEATASFAGIAIEGDASPALLAMWGTLLLGVVPEPLAVSQAPPSSFPAAASKSGESPDVGVILDMELPLVVRFGRTEMTIKALTGLAPGAVIDLGRSPDDPVEVLVSNKVVARGEVVTVNGHYGVRITDIISPAERARYMEVAA